MKINWTAPLCGEYKPEAQAREQLTAKDHQVHLLARRACIYGLAVRRWRCPIKVLSLCSVTCWLGLLVASTAGQLLNASGQVWSDGIQNGAKYIEIQVTETTSSTTFSGLASFKMNGEWIAQEQPFSGTQQRLPGGIVQFDATSNQGSCFSGWLFPGSNNPAGSNDRLCVYFTGPGDEPEPCPPDTENWFGTLERNTP